MSELQMLMNEYREMFGENYPLSFPSDLSTEEVIEDIRRCIETNTKAEEPEYYPEYDY